MIDANEHLKNWINEWFNSNSFTTDSSVMNERIECIEKNDHTKFNYETGDWTPLKQVLPEDYTFHMCYDNVGCYVSVVDENGSDKWGMNAIERRCVTSLIKKFGFRPEGINIFHVPHELACDHAPVLLKALGFERGEDIHIDRDISHG